MYSFESQSAASDALVGLDFGLEWLDYKTFMRE
jgi:hypothetical protein